MSDDKAAAKDKAEDKKEKAEDKDAAATKDTASDSSQGSTGAELQPNEDAEAHGTQIEQYGRTEPDLIAVRQGSFGVEDDGDTTGFGLFKDDVYMPGQSQRPYGGYFDEVVDILEELIEAAGLAISDVIEKVVVDRDELTIFIAREHIVQVCQWMRDDQDLRFEMNYGVTAVHYPRQTGRELHACWQLYSYTHGRTIRLESTCSDADPHIPSIVSVYPGDDWWEREAWDLMGIIFDGHPNLTRSAMPDDWIGHPQRKDYPLGGIPVQYKGATVPPADIRRVYR